eukprot:scaffold79442_cov66-Phaeocystis_antarctica.AAC.3
MKSGMDGELQIARFAELQDELELLGIPQERARRAARRGPGARGDARVGQAKRQPGGGDGRRWHVRADRGV